MELTNEMLVEAYETYVKHGTYVEAARAMGVNEKTVRRRVKRFLAVPENSQMTKEILKMGINPANVSGAWIKSDTASFYVKNSEPDMTFDEIKESLVEAFSGHAPKYDSFERPSPTDDDCLLVIDPADVHVGKLCAPAETNGMYNTAIAVERMKSGVANVMKIAQNYSLSQIVFVIGNDIIHVDNGKHQTTGGTSQDTDSQWWQMWLAAKKCYIECIEYLTQFADVHIVFCPSNHDRHAGWMLAMTVYAWFKDHPNVHFGENQGNITINDRKYFKFGKNLIGLTHGDNAKEKMLPALMQQEVREAWGKTKYAYWYVHHFHHKIRKSYGVNGVDNMEKDEIGVTVIGTGKDIDPENNVYVEYVRSPSPADGWHHRNGYINIQAIEAFIHHPELGQILRFTSPF